MKRICLMLVVCLALPISRVSADQAQVADSIRAIVGDTPITQQEIEQSIEDIARSLYERYGNQPDEFNKRVAALQDSSLDILIRREVILQEFKKNIKVPESIIDEYVNDEIKKRTGGDNVELTKQLELQGITKEEFKKRIRDQFIISAMQDKFIPEPIISPKKIEDYYIAHKDDYKIEDQVRMRMIVLGKNGADSPQLVEETRRRAGEILLQLKGGASFIDLAKTYSDGSTAKDGGDTGWEDVSVVNKTLVEALDKLKPGEYSQVIEAPDGFYLVMLQDRHPAHFKPLNEVRDQIEHTLDSQERDRMQKQWIERLKGKTFIAKF